MELSYSVLRVPKDGSTAEQVEDASAYSAESAIAAVSDGAGSAFESGRWARLLTQAFVDRPPLGLSRGEVLDWVGKLSVEWNNAVLSQNLKYYEVEKASSEGSAATLVGVHFEESESEANVGRWHCLAIGDSCLFQVSGGKLARAVPLTKSTDFSRRTRLFYTKPELSKRDIAELVMAQGTWRSGDKFLLLTDAIAEWFLSEAEQGLKPWEVLAALDEWSFEPFIADGRSRDLIHNDDVTVVMLETTATRRPIRQPELPAEHQQRPPAHRRRPEPVGNRAERRPPPVEKRLPEPTGPRPGRPSARPSPSSQRTRRRVATLIGALCLGLVVGSAIGWAVWHGGTSAAGQPGARSSPTVHPSPPSQTTAVQSAARTFAMALVTFNGDLNAYESSLSALSVPALGPLLPSVLHLSSDQARTTSSGQVVSITVEPPISSNAMLYVAIDQIVSTGTAGRSYQQFLLIKLQMSRFGSTWLVSGIELIKSAGRPLPVQGSAATPSGRPSRA